MRETLNLLGKVTKESLSYQKKLTTGGLRFLRHTMKAIKVSRIVGECMRADEGLLASPDIAFEGQKYWVLRYGPPFHRVPPPRNVATGYTLFSRENKAIHSLEKCRKVCRLYRIWEKFYIHPLKILRSRSLISWTADLKEKIFENIAKRRQNNYDEMEGSEEERQLLQELDEEVYLFHNVDMELLALEQKLMDLQFDLFDHPSETNVNDFISLVYRFKDIMPLERQYLDRRLNAWHKYRHLLERKYKVHVNLDFDLTDSSIAAFIDLLKYVLFQHVIPEAVLTEVTLEVFKSVGKAKISEFLLNLIVHYGGLKSLEAQNNHHVALENALNDYIGIWESEIPFEMIRLP